MTFYRLIVSAVFTNYYGHAVMMIIYCKMERKTLTYYSEYQMDKGW